MKKHLLEGKKGVSHFGPEPKTGFVYTHTQFVCYKPHLLPLRRSAISETEAPPAHFYV